VTYRFLTERAFAVGEDLVAAWEGLCARVPDARFFQRPAWVRATDRFRPESRIAVHAAFVGEELVAVAPTGRRRDTVHGMVCELRRGAAQDETQFTDVLVAPEHRTAAFVEAWLRHLDEVEGPWDAVRFPRLPGSGALLQAVPGADVHYATGESTSARVVDVRRPASLGRLSGRQLRNLERLERRARRELGPLERRTWTRPDDILSGFEQFLTLEASGWKGDWEHLSALAYKPPARAFYEAALVGLAPSGSARVDVLAAGGVPVAGHLAFRGGDTWYLLKIGYDEAHRRLGPGGLLLRDFLHETAADPGVRTVNLVTAPAWSDRWHMGQEASFDLWIYGATRRGRLLLAEQALADRARSVLHRGTPRLAS
jgi:CelD/BcsL family acetyltransferase involved in cellulose biosynthesis